MSVLPDVSAFPIEKQINNYQNTYYGNENDFRDSSNVNKKINEIFSSNNHVYKSKVKIKLKDDIIEKTIIGKSGAFLLTLDGQKVKIVDIIDIKKVD